MNLQNPSLRAHCNKCRESTTHTAGGLITTCKRCGMLNAVAIPSIKHLLISVREFNPEPLRMIVSYAVQDLSLFQPRRPLSRVPEQIDVLQSLRQCLLKNSGDWYAAYDFYYTTYALTTIPKSMFEPNPKSNAHYQVSALAGHIMFSLESINTFFFELLLLFEELPIHTRTNKEGIRTTIERIVTFVEAKTVPEICYNDDWYWMGGIALFWYAERLSIAKTYQLEKAINFLRSQNAFYLQKSLRREIINEITAAFQEEIQ